jgi:hypothetical protein
MDDARKFLRHFVPGSLAVFTLVVLLVIRYFGAFEELLGKFKIQGDNATTGLFSLLGAVIASGALGYLLSFLHNMTSRLPLLTRDYPEMFYRLQNDGLINVREGKHCDAAPVVLMSRKKTNRIGRKYEVRSKRRVLKLAGAWRMVETEMCKLKEGGKSEEKIYEDSVLMSDHYAAAGANLWGVVLAATAYVAIRSASKPFFCAILHEAAPFVVSGVLALLYLQGLIGSGQGIVQFDEFALRRTIRPPLLICITENEYRPDYCMYSRPCLFGFLYSILLAGFLASGCGIVAHYR